MKIELGSARGALRVNLDVGNLCDLVFYDGGRTLKPLHTAPWVDDEQVHSAPVHLTSNVPPVDRNLSGDFFCAPFGRSDVEPSPPHGWTANSVWSVVDLAPDCLKARLDRRVMGAVIEKTVRLARDAPLLYQTHYIIGGQGGLSVAHHPMIDVSGGARLFCSPKQGALTIEQPIVPGHHALACGAFSDDVTAIPASNGDVIDVTTLPISDDDEDFVALIEADGARLGWSAVLRQTADDIVFVLKDARVLPLTMLWHSNGGRKDFPWNGRHRGVLGIEDGCAAGGTGHKASLGANMFADRGIKTALDLPASDQKGHAIHHVIGAIARPPGWDIVRDIHLNGGLLTLFGPGKESVCLPFDEGFFPS